MRKNYFTKNLMAASMLLAVSMSTMSCSGLIDAIIGSEDRPVEQQAIQTIATVTGADPTSVSNALQSIVTDEVVAAAAAKGEPIKVTVAGSGVSTYASDQTITIPQKNGAEVEITFAAAPTGTESNALVLEASKGAGENPGDANNGLTVTMPPTEGLALTIELPETTVTLKTDGTGNVIYQDVIAKTAKQTIIIDKGVTIKEHELVGGNIVVKDGGAIETLSVTLKDKFGLVCLGSWWSGVSFKGAEPDYDIVNEDGSPYVPKYLRLKKGKGEYVSVETRCREDEYIEKVTVDEGITIASLGQYKYIEGKGNNRLHTRAFVDEEGGYFFDFPSNTELVSSFTIANEIHDEEALYDGVANLIINFLDSDTHSKTFTFDNCSFENSKTQFVLNPKKYKAVIHYLALMEGVDPEAPDAWMHVYDETDLDKLLELGVPNKEVEGGQSGGYWTDERLDDISQSYFEDKDLTFMLIFKNCTIGGVPITKDNVKFPLWGIWAPGSIKCQVIIDGTTYQVVSRWYGDDDPKNGTIELEKITD